MTKLPTFADAFKIWAYIGCVNFGGPAGQIALMHRVLVDEKKWISDARFFHALNYCMLLPGPEAQQLATYVGWLMHGVRGGLAAGLLFILPGALVMLGLSVLYVSFADAHWATDIFFGLKAAVLAIVIEALIRVSRRAFTSGVMRWIAAAAFAGLFFLAVPFPIVVLSAGLVGYFGAKQWPAHFKAAGHKPGDATAQETFALDHAMMAGQLAHTKTTRTQTLRTVLVWLLIWSAPTLLLFAILPERSVFTDISTFFSQMAIVTFGGAYAVLAYVAQEAVATYPWLTAPEMVDGLALAETTPGPLILVLQHVGFLAAYRNAGFDPMLAGVLGAMLTLWVTFAPSFLFIFAGAPYAERVRENKALSGALAAITAAVVGVIASLALWFAIHVLFAKTQVISVWPLSVLLPDWATIDAGALGLSVVTAILLLRFHLPVPGLLAFAAIAGYVVRMSGL